MVVVDLSSLRSSNPKTYSLVLQLIQGNCYTMYGTRVIFVFSFFYLNLKILDIKVRNCLSLNAPLFMVGVWNVPWSASLTCYSSPITVWSVRWITGFLFLSLRGHLDTGFTVETDIYVVYSNIIILSERLALSDKASPYQTKTRIRSKRTSLSRLCLLVLVFWSQLFPRIHEYSCPR